MPRPRRRDRPRAAAVVSLTSSPTATAPRWSPSGTTRTATAATRRPSIRSSDRWQGGPLRGLATKLDYIKGLGATTI
jgi:glycosidase